MTRQQVHNALAVMHKEWRQAKQRNDPVAKHGLRFYVAKENSSLYKFLQLHPHDLATAPKHIVASWQHKRLQIVSTKTLKKHAPAIADRYMVLHESGAYQDTLVNFISEIQEKCSNEEDLVAFLQQQ
ncbi:MAG: hypothetical protein HY006_04350 [Candidatus Sungbacteria bacterium]|nr:hypothetical protein [Candidatus Sungbacteria bacterium]